MKTWIAVSLAISLLALGLVLRIPGPREGLSRLGVATGSGAFPTSTNNFQDGDTINAGDWNAIENWVGIRNATNSDSLSYKLISTTSTDPGHRHSSGTVTGLTIGTNVQAWDALLDAIAALTTASDQYMYFTGSNTVATSSLSAVSRSLLAQTATSSWRTQLDVPGLASANSFTATNQFTFVSSTQESVVSSTITGLLFTNATGTNLSVSTLLGIPSGASPALSINGHIAHDTSRNQVLVYGSGTVNVYTPFQTIGKTIMAPTSTREYGNWYRAPENLQIVNFSCGVNLTNGAMPLTLWKRPNGSTVSTTITASVPCGGPDYATSTFTTSTVLQGDWLGVSAGTASGTFGAANEAHFSIDALWIRQ